MARAHQCRSGRLPRSGLHQGHAIPVAVVLDNLAAGLSAEEIVASYPPLGVDDVRAATPLQDEADELRLGDTQRAFDPNPPRPDHQPRMPAGRSVFDTELSFDA